MRRTTASLRKTAAVLDFLSVGVTRAAVVGVVAATLAAACDSGGGTPAPQATTPSASTSTTASPTPADAMKRLTALAVRANYRATYSVRQQHPSGTATWRVWRTPSTLRVDVTARNVTATLIVTPKASFSCRSARHRRTCFRVAGAGKPVPTPFQLLAQRLFSTDLARLAAQTASYDVTTPTPTPTPSGAAATAGSCFHVSPVAAAEAGVEEAIYCFSETGVLTAVYYPSGNAVRLVQVVEQAPPPSAFVPYSSPTPLPA
jgi:hypothetical protein